MGSGCEVSGIRGGGIEVASVVQREDVAVVGMMRHQVGVVIIHEPGFWEQPGVPGEVCATLAAVGIDILAISTSVSALSCVVAGDRLTDAVRVLKDAFDLS